MICIRHIVRTRPFGVTTRWDPNAPGPTGLVLIDFRSSRVLADRVKVRLPLSTPLRLRIARPSSNGGEGFFTTGSGRKVVSFGFRQRWDRDPAVPNPAYIPPQEGWVVPPSPLELPYPYPFAAPPVPVTPPLTRPNQEPGYQPQPQPKPSPAPRPLAPPGAVAPVPAIEWTPGEPATSGFMSGDHLSGIRKRRRKSGSSPALPPLGSIS